MDHMFSSLYLRRIIISSQNLLSKHCCKTFLLPGVQMLISKLEFNIWATISNHLMFIWVTNMSPRWLKEQAKVISNIIRNQSWERLPVGKILEDLVGLKVICTNGWKPFFSMNFFPKTLACNLCLVYTRHIYQRKLTFLLYCITFLLLWNAFTSRKHVSCKHSIRLISNKGPLPQQHMYLEW